MTENDLKNCTVKIETSGGGGTGFFVDKNIVLTCFHVVKGMSKIKVFWKNREYPASCLDYNEDFSIDLAILKVDTNNNEVVEIDSEIKIGDKCHTFGFPNLEDYHESMKVSIDEQRDDDVLLFEYKGTNSDFMSFKSDQFLAGYSGSPIWNVSTKKVCGVIKASKDTDDSRGGEGISIDKLSSHLKYEKTLDESLYLSVHPLPAEYLPRNEDMVKVKKVLLNDIKENKKIGLYGMGGIGKSVFSLALANDIEVKRYFKDGIYFIQLGESPDIENIQIELLKYMGIDNAELATIKIDIEQALLDKKALFIIDDVWDIRHINFLNIKNQDVKTLITTRKRDILRAIGAKEYLVNLLHPEQSLLLLKKKVGVIEEALLPLAEEILERCGYLPIAINIIGANLKGKDERYWNNILKKLKSSNIEKIKFDNANSQHQNLDKVIDISVNNLNTQLKDSYLSLSIFENTKRIPATTLEVYWGDDYLDLVDELTNVSLLFEDKDFKNKFFYYVHDLQLDYIKKRSDDDAKKLGYRKLLKSYKEQYGGLWSNIPIEDNFFYKNFLEICLSLEEKDLAQEISENLLDNSSQLSLPLVKKIISFFNLEAANIALNLLKNSEVPEVLIWVLNMSDSMNSEIQNFSKKYIEQSFVHLHIGLAMKCLDTLGSNSDEVQVFSQKYLNLSNEDLHPDLVIKCLNILDKTPLEFKNYAKNYISKDIFRIHDGLAIKCLDILDQNLEEVKLFAIRYIQKNEWNHRLALLCLEILNDDLNGLEEIRAFAKKYLNQDVMIVGNSLSIKCLQVLGIESEDAQVFANNYLSKSPRLNKLYMECINVLNDSNDLDKVFSELDDNNLIQKYINIFLKSEDNKYDINEKHNLNKYFRLLSIAPNDLYKMLYHEHKVYVYNEKLGDYAKYCNKHKESETKFRGVSSEEKYDVYHKRSKFLFILLSKFYLQNKNLTYPNNIVANILKTVDIREKLVYKEEIKQLFLDEINNEQSSVREKTILDLANYYIDIENFKDAIKTIQIGLKINMINGKYVDYAQKVLIEAGCNIEIIQKIMGDKYNKESFLIKRMLEKGKAK